jgi:hypothetical protein
MGITKQELKSRIGFILLGFFSFYLVEPLRELVDAHLKLNPFIIGGAGLLLVLIFFDF